MSDPGRPFFSKRFRQGLDVEKYGRWAPNITEETLEGLLCCLGQLGMRLHVRKDGEPGMSDFSILLQDHATAMRMRAALECIALIVQGEPLNDLDTGARIREACAIGMDRDEARFRDR